MVARVVLRYIGIYSPVGFLVLRTCVTGVVYDAFCSLCIAIVLTICGICAFVVHVVGLCNDGEQSRHEIVFVIVVSFVLLL